MSNAAIAGYIRGLIDVQPDLRITNVLQQIGVADNYLRRLASGDTIEPYARNLNALVLAVRGNLHEATALLSDDNASDLDGRRFAIDRAIDLGLIDASKREALLNASTPHLKATAARLRRKANRKS
jgi:hypothetical protein